MGGQAAPNEVERYVGRSVTADEDVQILACAGHDLTEWPWRFEFVRNAAKVRGYSWKTLPPELSTWDRVSGILGNGECFVFYVYAHGGYKLIEGDYRTYFNLPSGSVMAYPTPSGVYDDVQSLGLEESGRMKFVWSDSCFGGRADMAFAFGMNSDQNHENRDQAYVGWDEESLDDEEYTAFHGSFWFWFSAGADAEWALWLAGWEVSQDIWQNARTFGYPETTYMEP